MNNKEIINIKIEKEDFELLKVAIISAIQNSKQYLHDSNLSDEDKRMIEKDLHNYKSLLSKLNICESYNKS